MKKYLSVLLAMCMIIVSAVPAFAVEAEYSLEANISSDVYSYGDSIVITGAAYKNDASLANASVTIQAVSKESSNISFVADIKTDSNGEFVFVKEQLNDLELGEYRVEINCIGITKTLEFRVEDDEYCSKIINVKSSYYQGEDVEITVIAYKNGQTQSNVDVEVEISFKDESIKASTGVTDEDGKYTMSYSIPEKSEAGTYNIEAVVLGEKLSKQFTVKEKVALKSIEIVSSSTDLKESETLKLTLEGTMSDGTKASQSKLKAAVWSSSNSKIATVDKNGTVKGISRGTVEISAEIDGLSDEIELTVKKKSSGGGGGGGSSSSSSSSSKKDDSLIESTIPTAGGTIEDEDGNIELVFEKGTFDKKAEVKVELLDDEDVDEPKASHNIKRVADVYEFTSSIDEFNMPVKVKIKYSKSKLDGIDEELLGVYRFNEKADTWEYVGGKVDQKNRVVEVELNHFSKYTVMASTRTFADIANHWAKHQVEVMAARKIVDGMDGVNYAPQGTMTKAQFTKILVSLLGLQEEDYTGVFTDIKDRWYTGYVEAALKAGIIEGESTFSPDAAITREEMAVMIANTIKYVDEAKAISVELTFEDKDQISESAKEAVAIAFSNGIINGRTEATFVPQGTATRAEAATMVYRLLQTLDRL